VAVVVGLAVVALLLLALVEAGSLVAIAFIVSVSILVAVVGSAAEARVSGSGISGESTTFLTGVVAFIMTEIVESLIESLSVAVATTGVSSVFIARGSLVEARVSSILSILVAEVVASIMAVVVVTSSLAVAEGITVVSVSLASFATVGFVAVAVLVAAI
jgi:hypothetical protein